MSYYVITEFTSKEEAASFMRDQAAHQPSAVIVPAEQYHYKNVYDIVQAVFDGANDLTPAHIKQVHIPTIIEALSDYDYADIQQHIRALIDQQLA